MSTIAEKIGRSARGRFVLAASAYMQRRPKSPTWWRGYTDARMLLKMRERVVLAPIIAKRREAAGKIGDDNAPQTQGPEVDARRLPDVQTP